jgi:hypothetical protein
MGRSIKVRVFKLFQLLKYIEKKNLPSKPKKIKHECRGLLVF